MNLPRMPESDKPLRPRDLALLLLASGEFLPRKRARDQQADRAGLELKRRLLDRLVELDPDASQVEAALFRIVDEFGSPTGPTRALALSVYEEWQVASVTPNWLTHLAEEATRRSGASRDE
jgi:hypothetical protein